MVVEAHDEWAVVEWRYLSEESMSKISIEPEAKAVSEELPLAVTG